MDYFDIEALDSHIKKYKQIILGKLSQEKLNAKNFEDSSDLLCQVLDYSPSIPLNPKLFYRKISLKTNNDAVPGFVTKTSSNLSLNLEKQIDESDESLSEKDAALLTKAKLNRMSSVGVFIRSIVSNIIDAAVMNSESGLSIKTRKKSNVSKIASKVAEKGVIKVFLLNTSLAVNIEITNQDTFGDLKAKVIERINLDKEIKLRYLSEEYYEIRFVDDDDEVANMDLGPFEDNMNVMDSDNTIVAFIEKEEIES